MTLATTFRHYPATLCDRLTVKQAHEELVLGTGSWF